MTQATPAGNAAWRWMRRRGFGALAAAVLVAVCAAPGTIASAETQAEAVTRYRRELKRMQVDLMVQRARGKFVKQKAALKRVRAAQRRGTRLQVPPASQVRPPAEVRSAPAPVSPAALVPDRVVNDVRSDVALSSAQSEVSIAAWGGYLVAAWNDGELTGAPGRIGWAASTDGGETWSDGGSLPVTDTLALWESDPTLAVDERDGTFHIAALAITTQPLASALASVTGSFTPAGFVWGRPRVVRASRDTLPDKPWLACDPETGTLHVAYTSFFRRGDHPSDRIELQRSDAGRGTWEPPFAVSPPEDDGLVQGARPVVGPGGVVHVVWSAVDTSEASGGRDQLRARTSRDGGATFGPAVTVTQLYANFSSGAPGFNRGYGLSFPGLAVDRSRGPYRGRAYVTWSESLDYYDDTPGVPLESEGRTVVGGAEAALFRIGDLIRSQLDPDVGSNEYRFSAEAGTSVLFYMDSLAMNLDVGVRLICPETGTRLAFSQPGRGKPRFLLATLPVSGIYALRVTLNNPQGGEYRIRTGFATNRGERGRDQRDVFASWSDDGIHWSEPARVSDGAPRFDEWLPEIVAADNGLVYAAWYDWRETASPCRPLSQVYFARSRDGGGTWSTMGSLSTRASDWSDSGSNLVPNQGDYIALFAGPSSVFAAWADVRSGNPDVYFARWDVAGDPPARPPSSPVAIHGVRPNPGPGDAWVECSLVPGAPGRLDVLDLAGRKVGSVDVVAQASGTARVRLTNAGLAPGVYVLRLVQGGVSASARIAVVR